MRSTSLYSRYRPTRLTPRFLRPSLVWLRPSSFKRTKLLPLAPNSLALEMVRVLLLPQKLLRLKLLQRLLLSPLLLHLLPRPSPLRLPRHLLPLQ